MSLAMLLLVLGEVLATLLLVVGAGLYLWA
jgi:hypothetical protein